MKHKNTLKSILVLVVICLVIAVALAAVNLITADRIAEGERKKQEAAMSAVLPDNGGFEEIVLPELPDSVTNVYRDRDGEGYVVLLAAKGYNASKPMSVAVGLTNDGTIVKCEVISCAGETVGIGTKVQNESFLNRFEGADQNLTNVDTIGGATISSSALIDAVQDAFVALQAAQEVAS